MAEGIVFGIQRFSIHDGPGIRTTMFLKGCNMNCVWCHNPEGIPLRQILSYNASKCIGCRGCEAVCPQKVHTFTEEGHKVDRTLCQFAENAWKSVRRKLWRFWASGLHRKKQLSSFSVTSIILQEREELPYPAEKP